MMTQKKYLAERVRELEQELAAFHAECDKVGIPYDAAGLVRHHRGNGAMVGALEAYVEIREAEKRAEKAEAERDELQRIVNEYRRGAMYGGGVTG